MNGPENTHEFLVQLEQAISLLSKNNVGSILSLIGIALLVFTLIAVYKGVNADPDRVPGWLKTFMFIGLVSSIIFSAAGPAISLMSAPNIRKATTEDIIESLRSNSRIKKLIRFVAFDPKTQPDLELSKITHLGRESQIFTFVADYDELRGYTVAEALRKIGAPLRSGHHVSAFIFDIPQGETLYPANARGLLQVIERIESGPESKGPNFEFFDVRKYLSEKNRTKSSDILDNLGSTEITTWGWDSYGESYKEYCQAAQEFRCEKKYSARNLIGNLSVDWHPLGFARQFTPNKLPCIGEEKARLCEIHNWKQVQTELSTNFGARVFLIRNERIENIEGRYMIEFTQPETQIIPIIYDTDK
jgi:hypothetical protein